MFLHGPALPTQQGPSKEPRRTPAPPRKVHPYTSRWASSPQPPTAKETTVLEPLLPNSEIEPLHTPESVTPPENTFMMQTNRNGRRNIF